MKDKGVMTMSDHGFIDSFEHFSAAARASEASANAEPGKIVMYTRKNDITHGRDVIVSFAGKQFAAPLPSDLARSFKTVIGADREARIAILAKCFLRARLATLSESGYGALRLESQFGSYAEHLKCVDAESLLLATSLKTGFGSNYETLLYAVEDDIRTANQCEKREPASSQAERGSPKTAQLLSLFPAPQ